MLDSRVTPFSNFDLECSVKIFPFITTESSAAHAIIAPLRLLPLNDVIFQQTSIMKENYNYFVYILRLVLMTLIQALHYNIKKTAWNAKVLYTSLIKSQSAVVLSVNTDASTDIFLIEQLIVWRRPQYSHHTSNTQQNCHESARKQFPIIIKIKDRH